MVIDNFFKNSNVSSRRFEVARIEGLATYDRQERYYYDIFIFLETDTGSYLYAESRGPSLNGFLEARYFEEMIFRLELAN